MQFCFMCGGKIRASDSYISDAKGNIWCMPCACDHLSKWKDLEKWEQLAYESGRYNKGIKRAIEYMIEDDLCIDPNGKGRYCEASHDECVTCWLKFLTGDDE